jgi:RNase P subunit RPR2
VNLSLILADEEILKGLHLVVTLAPGQSRQICFACERPLCDRSHYRVQITGASGALLGIQICIDCQQPLYRAASDRRRAGKPCPLSLTKQELQIPAPKPIQLGTVFGTAASHAADAIQAKEDLFND